MASGVGVGGGARGWGGDIKLGCRHDDSIVNTGSTVPLHDVGRFIGQIYTDCAAARSGNLAYKPTLVTDRYSTAS